MGILLDAGLVRSRRDGRSIIYVAEADGLVAADAYLHQGRSIAPAPCAASEVVERPIHLPHQAPGGRHERHPTTC